MTSPRIGFLGLCLLGLTFPAAALTPLALGKVSNDEAARLLKAAYRDERPSIGAEWKGAQQQPAVARKICADSGPDKFGPRLIAVCSTFEDAGHAAPGAVDLWMLLDPRKRGERARIGASERNVATGNFGKPGDVHLIEVGPNRTAFALDSGFINMGWSVGQQTLYYTESDHFIPLVSIGTQVDNSGVCDAKTDRKCRRNAIAVECTLRADPRRYSDGFYDLMLDIQGSRGGKPVKRTIAIPRITGAYAVPAEQLEREACNRKV